jgi:uncharacterized membrane protein
MDYLLRLVLIGVAMFIVDLPWLMFTSPHWKRFIGSRGHGEMRPLFGIPVYLAMAYLFTLADSIGEAFLIGLATYLVFDGTNAVLFGDYPIWLGAADSLWGGLLFAAVYWIFSKLKL